MPKKRRLAIWSMAVTMLALSATSMAAGKPNILVLWGDDIGVWNSQRL